MYVDDVVMKQFFVYDQGMEAAVEYPASTSEFWPTFSEVLYEKNNKVCRSVRTIVQLH